MRIIKTLVLSMKHLKKSTQRFLSNDEGLEFSVCQLPTLDGFMINLEDDFAGVPEDLKTCIESARQNGADWLRFDETEDVVMELPVYIGDRKAMTMTEQSLIPLSFEFQKLLSAGRIMDYEEIRDFFSLTVNPEYYVQIFLCEKAQEFDAIWNTKPHGNRGYLDAIHEFGEKEILAVFSKDKI